PEAGPRIPSQPRQQRSLRLPSWCLRAERPMAIAPSRLGHGDDALPYSVFSSAATSAAQSAAQVRGGILPEACGAALGSTLLPLLTSSTPVVSSIAGFVGASANAFSACANALGSPSSPKAQARLLRYIALSGCCTTTA